MKSFFSVRVFEALLQREMETIFEYFKGKVDRYLTHTKMKDAGEDTTASRSTMSN